MPRDSNGVYTLPAGNPVISGSIIESNWANTTMPDLGNEISDSLSRSGEGGMLAPLRHIDGTVGMPAVTWVNEVNTGWYRFGANDIRFAMAADDLFRLVPAGPEVWNGSAWVSIAAGVNGIFPGPNPVFPEPLATPDAALVIGASDPDTEPSIGIGPSIIQGRTDAENAGEILINPWGGGVYVGASQSHIDVPESGPHTHRVNNFTCFTIGNATQTFTPVDTFAATDFAGEFTGQVLELPSFYGLVANALNVLSTKNPDLLGPEVAFSIGTSDGLGSHLTAGPTTIQAKLDAVTAGPLNLNPLGGEVRAWNEDAGAAEGVLTRSDLLSSPVYVDASSFSSYTLVEADLGKTIFIWGGTAAFVLNLASGFPDGWWCNVINRNVGGTTEINPVGGATMYPPDSTGFMPLNGSATLYACSVPLVNSWALSGNFEAV
jgi:hypothetical protein